ncbi:prepilin-type N-terminal cleavage/methylation domain-containing protein [Sharpea azabuensis]|uniref:prepilin-type N-terminal cleavage/methylation domain-containing protein n=1 Tax=Sharpea azabuensis TaxID=322505 RepID=UPI0013DC7066|nr:prepilin-type N-terminal cleavage/methylation domain-containing protein [Sharpea azabuensis]
MNKKGFTLIEVIVSIAILSIVLGVMSTGVNMVYRHYNASNSYKDDSDNALLNVQGAYHQDTQMKGADYMLEISGDDIDKKIQLFTYTSASYHKKLINSTSTAEEKKEAVYLTRLEAQSKEIDTKFYLVDAKTGRASQVQGLETVSVNKFDDLPNESWDSLANMNNEWGKWSFAGMSLSPAIYDDNGNLIYVKENKYYNKRTNEERYKKPIWEYIDVNKRNDSQYFYTGYSKPLEYDGAANEWKGIITEDNFKDFKNKVKSGEIDMKKYALVPTYFFSKDIYDSPLDTILLNDADNNLREKKDAKNIQALAEIAAKMIKDNNLQYLDNELTSTNNKNALYGDGLEIIHFREAGWGIIAENDYNYKGGQSQYETSNIYRNLPHLSNGWNESNGFFKEMFQNIGLDITELNNSKDWLGIHYGYNRILFSDKIADQNATKPYSLFMKVDKMNKNVTVFVGEAQKNLGGWSDPRKNMVISPNYVATASYA